MSDSLTTSLDRGHIKTPYGTTQRGMYDRLLRSLSPEDPDRAQVVARATHFAVHSALRFGQTERLEHIVENHAGILIVDTIDEHSESFAIGEFSVFEGEPLPSLRFIGSTSILSLCHDRGKPFFNLVGAGALRK